MLSDILKKTRQKAFLTQEAFANELYDPTLADAICDRIVYNSHVLTIKGESMRRMNAISE